jgi:hypothetical protein
MLFIALLAFSTSMTATDPWEREKDEIFRLELATRVLYPGNEALPFLIQLRDEKIAQLPSVNYPGCDYSPQSLVHNTCNSCDSFMLLGFLHIRNQNRRNQYTIAVNMAQAELDSSEKKIGN